MRYPYFVLIITVVIGGDVDVIHYSEHGVIYPEIEERFLDILCREAIQNSNLFTTRISEV